MKTINKVKLGDKIGYNRKNINSKETENIKISSIKNKAKILRKNLVGNLESSKKNLFFPVFRLAKEYPKETLMFLIDSLQKDKII